MYRSKSSNRKQNFCRLPWRKSTLRYSTHISFKTTSSRVQSTIPQCFKIPCCKTHHQSVVSPILLTRPTTTPHSQPLLNLISTLRTWTSIPKDWKCSDSTLLNSSSLPTWRQKLLSPRKIASVRLWSQRMVKICSKPKRLNHCHRRKHIILLTQTVRMIKSARETLHNLQSVFLKMSKST